MGKKYFCEHCQKSTTDNYEARRKHLNSANHKLLVKLHYNQHIDYKTLVQEESKKNLCLRSLRNQCPFGDLCRNTHYTKEQLREIELQGKQIEDEATKICEDKILNADLSEWYNSINAVPKCFQNNLAIQFQQSTSVYLPPSLRETTVEDVQNMEFTEWG